MKRRNFLKAAGVTALGTNRISTGASRQEPVNTNDSRGNEIVWSRKIPVAYSADVAVVGGGISGVSAACAAARSGVNTILVERFAVTGGMLTTGGVANFCGEMKGQGEIFDQILSRLKEWQAIGYGKETCFHYEILALILQELLLEYKIKLLLHTRFIDARVGSNGLISEIIISGKSGPQAIRASQFIDCTGDGDLARASGFETLKGGPSGYQLPMSMMYFVRHVTPEEVRPHLPDGWFHPLHKKEDLPMTSVWPDGPGGNAIKIKIPMFDSTDTESLTNAEIAGRRRMMEVLDFHQRQEKQPWNLDHCSPIIGIREGCRIVGDYILKVDDLRAGRKFDDGVARGTYYLDGHKPDDDKRTYILPQDELAVPPYQIPLRSLIAKDGQNLMMAGRCFSADQLALSSARVSTTGSMMGQAAGITAALCIRNKCYPRDLDPEQVKNIILKRGANLAV